MEDRKIRVRFAPSPTGGLHLGGVRTVLYNYLFARQQQGTFVLRIEDTDQSRYVPGAEEYIYKCLAWCGLLPDESPLKPGVYGPYRQSERKPLYLKYAEQLIARQQAYYAFDTAEELDKMRSYFKTEENPSPQYDRHTRMNMKNSLVLTEAETQQLIHSNTPYVIRIKMPENEIISFTDMVHGEVSFNSSLVDDKVLLKADGMPTYHLAVVVDDFLMKITHAFRGEEWLSSAPVHILLWKYLFGLEWMPQWAHLPLILGPHGKLSKRDGAKYGFPVFAMNWTDPKTNELTEGFYEKGFLPEAFINQLAVLGWNDGSEQELFDINELIAKFSLDRVHTSGAKFDFEKAKWFNQEWIKKLSVSQLRIPIKQIFEDKGIAIQDEDAFDSIIELVKDRCTLLPDFYIQASYFFKKPEQWDVASVKPKWNLEKSEFFNALIKKMNDLPHWEMHEIENIFKSLATEKNIKAGELQLPFRVMLVGGKFGPAVFMIAEKIGKDETIGRVSAALNIFNA